jgi:hypothetical protein
MVLLGCATAVWLVLAFSWTRGWAMRKRLKAV